MRILLAPIVVSSLTSCAAIVAPKTFNVPIDSVPPGAVVAYRDANVGVTPCTVKMHRSCSRVVLKREGFHDQWVDVGTGTSGWIVGNVVFGGLIGLIVDLAGGAKTLNADACWVALTPTGDPLPAIWERTTEPATTEPDAGWVREGQAQVAPVTKKEHKASRAPALPSSATPTGTPKPASIGAPDSEP